MIETSLGYITVLIAIIGVVTILESKFKWKIFTILPSIVIIYALVMTLSSLGLWSQTKEIDDTYKGLKDAILPAMIFIMLLGANLKTISMLGGKMIFTFMLATLSIMIGFIVSFALIGDYLDGTDTYKTIAALCGSWIGGTGNMMAIQSALVVSSEGMGYALITDSVNYTIWVMLLLSLVSYAQSFNRWSGADVSRIDEISKELDSNTDTNTMAPSVSSIFILLGVAFMVNVLAMEMAKLLPSSEFLSTSTWHILIVTIAGILTAMTPLGKKEGASLLSSLMLYMIVALIASRADFSQMSQAPMYILLGAIVLLIHALLMTIFAKIFKLDLFSIGVASLANIGGVASAPILASAYSKSLVPIGVLMAMLGYIIGTAGGLIVGKILKIMIS